jgi:large subunit ribosomal protein L11
MSVKKIIGNLKLRIPAGRATAGPPVGSTLGQWGLNMMQFINPFNEATKDLMGKDVIVHLQVYEDRTFTWKSLGRPVADLILEKANIKKGSGKSHLDKVGKITIAQCAEIAETKKDQLNAIDEAGRIKVIAGTARSMGVEVEG